MTGARRVRAWPGDPLSLWRRHFPLRLAVTTAAVLVGVLMAILVSTYAAVASLLWHQLDARAVAAAPLGARHLEPFEAEEPWEPEDHEREPEGGSQRWVWTIRAGGPQGPVRPWFSWLWPAAGDVRVGQPAGREGPAVVEELDDLAETLAGLRLWLLGLGGAGTALVSTVAFVSARRAFQPVQAMIDAAARIVEARRISPDALAVEVPPARTDVTLERLAGLLNTLLARVRDALSAQARFVDDASHELRTPLGALRADLEVALRQHPEPAPCRQAMERALSQVVRLGRLADGLLALARYERGNLVQPVPGSDLAEAVRQAIVDVRHLADAAGVTVVAELPERLPATCDVPAIARLVTNLLTNAIEASPADGVVSVRAGREGACVVLEVADSGAGMTPEEAARAFEPFFRGARPPSSPGKPSGTGLGLAIVQAIVEAHGGKIGLETAPGKGTRVRVQLPA